MKSEYIIGCQTEQEIDKVIKQLSTPGELPDETNLNTLSASIEIANYLPSSFNQVVVLLTGDQVQALSSCSYIDYVEPVSAVPAMPFSQRGKTRTLSPSAQAFNNTPHGIPEQWGFGSCNSLSTLPPFNNQFTYHYTGSGVDLIVIDSGIVVGHPEWNDQFGNSRLELVNWSLFAPITANKEISVTQDISNGNLKINGVDNDTVYVVKDRVGSPTTANPAGGYPVTYRTGVYNFNLSNLNTTFHIGSAVGHSYSSKYVTNNGASTGTVSLTVFPLNQILTFPHNISGNPNVMYYWSGSSIDNNGVISRTDYNCQSENSQFYGDSSGHGSHCTGIAAGSACGWAIDSKIYSGRINFSTVLGYSNGDLGIMLLYDLITSWHNNKMTIPGLSSRPTVTSNSYGWGYGETLPQVDTKVKQLTDAGVHFVRAAGNENRLMVIPTDSRYNSGTSYGSPGFPTNLFTNQANNPVVVVGAIGGRTVSDLSGACTLKAEYSNFGNGISIYAPGSYIQSVGVVNGNPYPGYPGYFLLKASGTSMACPNVAGLLCTVLEKFPNLTPQQAKNFIMQCANVGTLSSYPFPFNVDGFSGYYLDTRNNDPWVDTAATNLEVSKFPPTTIATVSSSELFAKYLSHCYTRVDTVPLTQGGFYYLNSTYNSNTSYYINSSTDLRFSSNCTPG